MIDLSDVWRAEMRARAILLDTYPGELAFAKRLAIYLTARP